MYNISEVDDFDRLLTLLSRTSNKTKNIAIVGNVGSDTSVIENIIIHDGARENVEFVTSNQYHLHLENHHKYLAEILVASLAEAILPLENKTRFSTNTFDFV